MENLPQERKTKELAQMLRRINQGANPKTIRRQAHRLMLEVTPADIALAEKRLISTGYSAQLAGQLSAALILIGLVDSKGVNLRDRLPDNHILRTVLAEHELIRCFLADLDDVVKVISDAKELSETSLELMKLSHIVEHLYAMDQHIQREQDVIFPCLKKHGWSSLCRTAEADHVHIKTAIENLLRLIGSYREENLGQFKQKLVAITSYLCPVLREHLFQEDNILYPVALEVVRDKKIWSSIKTLCGDLGYCGTHL